MNVTLILAYMLLAVVCTVGAFSRSFAGDSLQRLGLCVLFFCYAGRAYLLISVPYSWPHEPWIVLGSLLYASGTIRKTAAYCLRRRKFKKLMKAKGSYN